MPEWIAIAFQKTSILRATKCAAVVGPILVIINHGSAIMAGEITVERIIMAVLTIMVPYCVSTVSTVGSTLELKKRG